MGPRSMNRISERKKRRKVERKRKKHNKTRPKSSHQNRSHHVRFDNHATSSSNLSRSASHHNEMDHNLSLDESLGAKRSLNEVSPTNGNGVPPPIVTDSQKLVRLNVDFVFPRDRHRRVAPFVFDRQKNPHDKVQLSNTEKTDSNTADAAPRETIDTSETIEDILYHSKGRGENKHPTTSKGQLEAREETVAQKDLSGVSTEAKRQNPVPPETAGRKRPRETQQTQHAESDNYRGQLSGLSVEDAVRDKFGCRPRSNSTDGELKLPRRGLCDEHMVLESHKWRMDGNNKSPKGFVNLGNTCFLNATLQCLAYLPTFCQCLVALPPKNIGNKGKMSKGQRLTAMLRSLLRQVHGMDANGNKGHAIAPHAIVSAVPSIGGKSCKFRPGRQEDAHEFLVHLLDSMKDGELKAAGVNQQMNGWRERLPIPRLDETTLIHRVFGGYLRSQVRCTSCGHRSNTYDPFLDLALEVSKGSSNSVASAFSEFTRKETLDSANRWKCSGCKKHVCASKQLTVFRPPLSLCIQLKRFAFGGGFGGFSFDFGHYGGRGMTGRGGSKITKPIEFPCDLKLPLSDGRKCEYKLTGIVIHVGGSASSGHYTAYVRKPGAEGANRWYHMDDSFVEEVSEKTVLRQRDAYVLFYCRREVKLEFPPPPQTRSMTTSEARELGAARARARSESKATDRGKNLSFSDAPDETPTAVPPLITMPPVRQSFDKQQADSPATKGAPKRVECSDSGDESSASSSSATDSDDATNEKESNANNADVGKESLATTAPPSTLSQDGSEDAHSQATKPEVGQEKGRSALDKVKPTEVSMTSSDSGSSSTSSSSDSDSESGSSSSSEDDEVKKGSSSVGSNGVGQESRPEKSVSHAPAGASSETEPNSSEPKVRKIQGEGTPRTKVVLDRGKSRGKVEVMLGPRFRSNPWKPKGLYSRTNEQEDQHLLGNMTVGKWDEDDPTTSTQRHIRANAVKQIKKQENSRKRRMHLDRWDAMLDEGKKKKIKVKQNEPMTGNVDPKKNPYHRIQSSIQRMSRGRAKGAFRQKDKSNAGKRPAHRHAPRR